MSTERAAFVPAMLWAVPVFGVIVGVLCLGGT